VKKGFFAINRVFCYPHCRKIVGISAGTQKYSIQEISMLIYGKDS